MSETPETHQCPLSVVIPARDEEAGLPEVLTDLGQQPLPEGTEILVVDDGSRDRTAAVAEESGAQVLSIEGRGYGGALKAGFAAARGEWLAFLDADATYPAATLVELWDAKSEASGMLLANRFSDQNHMPWTRRIGNRVLSRIAALHTRCPIPDLCSGERLFPRRLLHKLDDLPNGLEFSPALTVRFLKRGYRVEWLSSPYHDRVGRSKLSIGLDGYRFLKAIFVHT